MEEAPVAAPRRLITWRSVGLGLLLAVGIACVSPYNDYVVNNSYLIGSYFPPVVTLAVFAFVLLVNGPLHKFAPRWALSSPELAVVMAMGLLACSIPGQGLMRMFVPMPVAPFYFTDKADYHELLQKMHLPRWLFAVSDPANGNGDRAYTAFYSRLTPGEHIPWRTWLPPLVGWGTFAAAFLATLFALACVLRYQWTTNERLAFPIAQLQGMLIAPPKPGRAFNELFSSRAFWIGCGLIFVLQSTAVLNLYFPSVVPEIPLSYDLTTRFAEQPWTDLPVWIKTGTLYFTLLGLSYFTPTRVSFSLWSTAVGVALLRWAFDPSLSRLAESGLQDQQLGAAFAVVAGVLWVGRQHWAVLVRSLIGRRRPGDAQGVFLTYRVASIALLVGVGVMFAWLCVVGMTPWLAAACVLMIVMAHVLTARVVAETGFAFVRVPVPFDSMLKAMPANWLTPRDAFLYGSMHYGYMQAARESELVFAMHGLNVINDAAETQPPHRGAAAVLIGTLVVTFVACVMASLWCYYNYATPLWADNTGLLNPVSLSTWPKMYLVEFPTAVGKGVHTAKINDVWTQVAIGIGVAVVLQALSWRFASWPLLPVGYLMCGSGYVHYAWLSLLLGWGFKVLILRFGGAKLFNDLKPFFVGLIFGEALAVGVWLIVTLVLALSGEGFQVVRFLPQ